MSGPLHGPLHKTLRARLSPTFSLALNLALSLASLAGLSACGGGGSTTAPTPPVAAQNVVTVSVDAGPVGASGHAIGAVNLPYISLTLCTPGSSTQCQTLDHVEVDTGSTGLRVLASALNGTAALTPELDANGNPLAECGQFVASYTWGAVKRADVRIAGELASSVPVQVIGDTSVPAAAPSDCSNGLAAQGTVDTLGANAILGIGVFKQDCGTACTTQAVPGVYYVCPSGACQGTPVGLDSQVNNPVNYFATDNNGSLLTLPSVGSGGVATATGSLIFGIGTQTNNGLGSAAVLTLDTSYAEFTTTYKGQSYPASYIDSGSNGYFFPDASITQCTSDLDTGFYCPNPALNLSATNTGQNGVTSSVAFTVADADMLLAAPYAAIPNLGGTANVSPGVPAGFAWGFPFFYGRTVFTAIEDMDAGGNTGPFFAY